MDSSIIMDLFTTFCRIQIYNFILKLKKYIFYLFNKDFKKLFNPIKMTLIKYHIFDFFHCFEICINHNYEIK